jgi:type VI secretion system protein ImpF
MASAEPTVRPSLLDRLDGSLEPATTWNESVRQLKRSLLRDMEWLLNTRRVQVPAPDHYPEVQHSVYHYGLPDVSSMSHDPETVRTRLCAYIAETIRLFEPRLSSVRVTPTSDEDERHAVRFSIDAVLNLDPTPERIVFDTVLETARGDFQVEAAPHA